MENKTLNISRQEPLKRLRSCYICEVSIYSDYVVLEDSGRVEYYITKDNIDAMASFKLWFSTVFMKGIPQVLTIVDYAVMTSKDGDSIFSVNRIIANPNPSNADKELAKTLD